MPLDELVGAPDVGDPRIRLKPRSPQRAAGLPADAAVERAGTCGRSSSRPSASASCAPTTGYEWLYVLSGEMRLILGEHDITMRARRGRRVRHAAAALVRPGGRRAGRDPERARQPRRAHARPRRAAAHERDGLTSPVRSDSRKRQRKLSPRLVRATSSRWSTVDSAELQGRPTAGCARELLLVCGAWGKRRLVYADPRGTPRR